MRTCNKTAEKAGAIEGFRMATERQPKERKASTKQARFGTEERKRINKTGEMSDFALRLPQPGGNLFISIPDRMVGYKSGEISEQS